MARFSGYGDGYFPRGRSMLRRVHEERLVGLFYGQRALCIGAVKPLNYVGTSEHSYAKLTPFRRLVHTGHAFEKIYFGSRSEADRALDYVDKLHERVSGVLTKDAGATPAGTPYSAFDPALMLWTVAVIADSAQRFFELFVSPTPGPVALPRRWGQPTSSTTLPVAPRSSSSTSASPARSSG
jgi:uncharacterized protein (DUF2236 family)